ncbi:MAG: formylglycine-generating enzyme family protein [Candidatus Brocadiaceae bacterium]|nr:formylglycine-generating enzyme family protein [Candidatus Brocadiaceae bacterium]
MAELQAKTGPGGPETTPPAMAASDVPAGWTAEARRVTAATPDGETVVDVVYYRNSIGMELAAVPAGAFAMGSPRGEPARDGSERPQHEVRITRPFLIGAFEVTQEQYEAVMGGNPSQFPGARRPVDSVSWHDAVEFCRRLSEAEDCTYRLPTEAEWEYACRAGSTESYSFGADPQRLDTAGWYSRNSGGRSQDVGGRLPNAWGLYDMHGNVWEWCLDWYDSGAYRSVVSAEDPTGPARGAYRVVRGGSWFDYPVPLRSAARGRDRASNRVADHGFRVVCELMP